ncbi:hypothetical protein R84981_002874 [Carnimonas sp. R-84981]|uniref:hypothetical protein n=1 Tax=Carnimonas bestiolae TaxID=3402172 RepID=UPI003EDC071E
MDIDELLNKLVMEVAEWPTGSGCDPELPKDCFWMHSVNREPRVITPDGGLIYKQHWLQRRRELINEPDDSDAPDWAEWVFQQPSGYWVYSLLEPNIDDRVECFALPGFGPDLKFSYGAIGIIPAGHDWRKTLRRVKKNFESVYALSPEHSHNLNVNYDMSIGPEKERVCLSINVEIDEACRERISSMIDRLGKAQDYIERAKDLLAGVSSE